MAWLFLINFNDEGGNRDITALVDLQSIRRKLTLWNDLQPTANTLTFDLNRNPTILNLLLTNENDTDIVVTKNGSGYFKGTVRPNFKVTVGAVVGQVKIECVDLAEKLKRKIDTTFAWESYTVCDTVSTASSIVHQLLIKAGFELEDINVSVDIAKTIDFFVNVPVHADQTYWDALSSILFEFGYVWYFDADGKFNIYDFLPTSTTTADAFDNSKMLGELTITKRLMSFEGTEVRLNTHKTEAGALVFNDTTGGSSDHACDIVLDPAENYPEGSADRYVYSEYQFEGGEIIIVKNAAISVTKDSGVDYDDAFVSYYKRALFSFINNAGVAKHIYKLQIIGDVTFKGDLTKCRCLLVANTEKLLTHEATWITTMADGDKLAIGLARHYKYADFQYTLRSKTVYALGGFVDIEDDMLGIDNRCVIVGIEDMNPVTGERVYSLEGIEEYSAESVESEGTFTPAPPFPPGTGPAIVEGTAPSYTEIIEGFTLGGGTKTPTQVTVAECKSLGIRANILRWDRQLDLTNFDHYEIQVSSNQTNWYALKNDGTDWKGVEDATTDVDTAMVLHENIPPAGTADLPTAFALYYRVRRVTKEPVEGAWSATANATFNLITSGYIQEDAITSEKLIDAAVEAAKIAALAVTEGKIAANAVVAGKIAAGAVTTDKLYALSVTAAKLAAGSVETAKIAALAVTAGCISANAIETAKIAANAITADKILAAAIQVMLLRTAQLWIGYSGTGTYDDPDEGDRRIYLDGDEIKFQEYTNGAWSSVNQIVLGGVDSDGVFLPFLGCRGLYNTESPAGEPIPDSTYKVFDFDSDFLDQDDVDWWTTETNVTRVAGKFGNCLTRNADAASNLTHSAIAGYMGYWTPGEDQAFAFWFKIVSLPGSPRAFFQLRHVDAASDETYFQLSLNSSILTLSCLIDGAAAGSIASAAGAVVANTWCFIGVVFDRSANTQRLIVNGTVYSGAVSDYWSTVDPAFSVSIIFWLATGAGQGRIYIDDLILRADRTVDPDLFLQHYLHELPWTGDYSALDVLLKPATGGVVRLLGDAVVSGGLRWPFLHVQDQKAANTGGGDFTSGAWRTRVLNTVLTNEIAGASLAANQITLPAGTYEIYAYASAYYCGRHKAKLRNITASADLLIGSSERSDNAGNSASTSSWVTGRFTLGVESAVELQHRCEVTKTTNGFGLASNYAVVELYADVQIRKVS